MALISISRQFGAGGHTLGQRLADRLGYQLVEREIIAQVAKEANVSVAWVEAVEKEAGGLLMKLVNSLISSNFIERITGVSASDFDEKRYYTFLSKVIQETAREGNIVFIGRGSQYILAENPGCLKVLLVANLEDRIRFMMEHYELTEEKAAQVVQREEKRRLLFLKGLDPRDPDNPSIYDLIINTGRVTLEEAEEMVMHIVRCMVNAAAKPIW